MIDRQPHSKNIGSLSRIHWAWKFNDFPFPRLQEGVFYLSYFYSTPMSNNPLYRNSDVLSWLESVFKRWITLQNSDGSFDEAYPNEKCLAATAFTGFYISEAFLRCKEMLSQELQAEISAALSRAGDWLSNNTETHGILSNHLACAVAACELISQVTGREQYHRRAQYFLEVIFSHQSEEGWMKEYSGADIGYGTHTFFYLARYFQITKCQKTLLALQRFAGFLKYFCHPDGTLGGEYSSRHTEFSYPAGFEMLSPYCRDSAAIAKFMREALEKDSIASVRGADDFNLFPLLNNLLFAHESFNSDIQNQSLPWEQEEFSHYFGDAGIWVYNCRATYIVVGVASGGTVSVYDKIRRSIRGRHSGYLVNQNSSWWASQDYHVHPCFEWIDQGSAMRLEVRWRSVSRLSMSSWLFLGFRLFTLTVGRHPAVSRALKARLVKVLILKKSNPPIKHQREIHIQSGDVNILDVIESKLNGAELIEAAQFMPIHMGSAGYADVRSWNGSSRKNIFKLKSKQNFFIKISGEGVSIESK